MKAALALLASLGLAACATTAPRTGALDDWLPGTWLLLDEREGRSLAGCASDRPVRYDRDGTYRLYGESGVWRLDGDRLVETARAVEDPADRASVGRSVRNRVVRVGRDEMVKLFERGGRGTFLRCPESR